MVIVRATVMECRYQTGYRTTLLLRVYETSAVVSWVKYATVWTDVCVVGIQGVDCCDGALGWVYEAVTVTVCFGRAAGAIRLKGIQFRVDSLDTKRHVSINPPLIHLFMIERLLKYGRKGPQHNLLPFIRTTILISNRNILNGILSKIWWYQIRWLRHLLYLWGYDSLC